MPEFETQAERDAYELGKRDARSEKLTIPKIQKMTAEEIAAYMKQHPGEVEAVMADAS